MLEQFVIQFQDYSQIQKMHLYTHRARIGGRRGLAQQLSLGPWWWIYRKSYVMDEEEEINYVRFCQDF